MLHHRSAAEASKRARAAEPEASFCRSAALESGASKCSARFVALGGQKQSSRSYPSWLSAPIWADRPRIEAGEKNEKNPAKHLPCPAHLDRSRTAVLTRVVSGTTGQSGSFTPSRPSGELAKRGELGAKTVLRAESGRTLRSFCHSGVESGQTVAQNTVRRQWSPFRRVNPSTPQSMRRGCVCLLQV